MNCRQAKILLIVFPAKEAVFPPLPRFRAIYRLEVS
jgi:hypothetical protein